MNELSTISDSITSYVTSNSLVVGSGVILCIIFYIYIVRRERKKVNAIASDKITVMQKAFETCQDAILILSKNQEIVYVNMSMHKLLSLPARYEGMPLGNMLKIYVEKEWRTLSRLLKEKESSTETTHFSFAQTKLLGSDGKEIPINLYISSPEEEEVATTGWYIVTIHDLTEEQKRKEAQYHHRLTELPNQIKALHDINSLNAKLHLSEGKLVLMLINIDKLAILRSILGYQQTNAILKKFAFYLQRLSKEKHFGAYHTFYNNFLLIFSDVKDLNEVKALAKRIQEELSVFFKIGESRLYLSASIGISAYPDSGPVIKLFDNAYKALSNAEKDGYGRIEFYIPEERTKEYDELILYNDMHEALERNQFEVYYQAIVDAKTHEVRSAEALIRWHHPEYGMVPPDLFIAVMEKTGFIVELGHFVLDEVLKQQKRWELFKFKQIPVAINLSLIELEMGTFVDYVEERIAHHQANPELIRFEITEGLAMQDKAHFATQFSRLKKMGIAIVLDDFGSGYTSYAYLKRFPAALLKIDKVLVDHILNNKDDQYIVKSIIDLGHSLGMKVVIEGIENNEMASLLESYGCDFFQGFHFARPLPVFEFQKMLRK